MSEVDVSRELAVFLRTRRERRAPADAGLPDRRRARRTPGLRREDVAELAGVSVDYVTRLEQGRGLRPSPNVLNALARALGLSDDERGYLFDLARQRSTGRRRTNGDAGSLAYAVRALSPLPAMVLDRRFDIRGWNREMAGLMMDFAELPDEQRNAIWLCTVHPAFRDFYRDRERIIRANIADLRAAWAADPGDVALARLIDGLRSHSHEFARCWDERDVRVNGTGTKPLLHPKVGPLTVAYDVLTPLGNPGLRLVVYRATDAASQAALDAISGPARGQTAAFEPT